MKTLILLAVVGVALGITDLRDGRPLCTTDEEMATLYYRNLWDANSYYVCQRRNVPAVLVRCNSGGFMDSVKKCVDWDIWEWEIPVPPPSLA